MSALPQLRGEPRLVVALVAHGGRMQALLRAYLSGPGAEHFVISHPGRSQALIADFDNEPSRIELERFLASGRGPAIVLAQSDPRLPGTVWVPKPVQYEALFSASLGIWELLSALPSSPPVRPALRLLTPPARPLKRVSPVVRDGATLPGPFRMAPREDWTARIAWVAMGVLGIVAVAAMLGWRPADQHWRPAASRAAATADANAAAVSSQQLRAAVQAAWLAAPPRSERTQQQLQRELQEMRALQSMQPQAASLSKLAQLPDWPAVSRKALPAAQLAPAEVPWQVDGEHRQQLASAVELSLAATPIPHTSD